MSSDVNTDLPKTAGFSRYDRIAPGDGNYNHKKSSAADPLQEQRAVIMDTRQSLLPLTEKDRPARLDAWPGSATVFAG
jgi:hypothetical protein